MNKNTNPGIVGSGTSITKSINLPEFSDIKLSISYEKITINANAKQLVKIIGDDNIVPFIDVVVLNNVLQISSDSSFSTNVESEIIVNIELLKSFTFDGIGEVVINNLNQETFNCIFNGIGSCVINGNANNFDLLINGLGSVDAKNLITENVIANLYGVGSAEVYAGKSIGASVNGIGNLTYYGNPQELKLDDSGLGGIERGD